MLGCRTEEDCPPDHYCNGYKCVARLGKVLLESFTIQSLSCTGCNEETEGLRLSLVGERSREFNSGYTCTTSDLVPLSVFRSRFSGGLARFDGSTAEHDGRLS